MLPALLKDKNEQYNYMTIIAQLLSSCLFLSRPALLLSKISKPYQDNPLPYHRFCCSIVCKFNIAIIVSQITGAHNLRKNTVNVGKDNRVKIILPLVITYWAIQVGNKTIRSYNRLELQGMYPFVAIVDDSLISEWAANRADSAINETPAVIQRCNLLMDCICICSQRGTGEEGLVKISKVVAMFVVNPV